MTVFNVAMADISPIRLRGIPAVTLIPVIYHPNWHRVRLEAARVNTDELRRLDVGTMYMYTYVGMTVISNAAVPAVATARTSQPARPAGRNWVML